MIFLLNEILLQQFVAAYGITVKRKNKRQKVIKYLLIYAITMTNFSTFQCVCIKQRLLVSY